MEARSRQVFAGWAKPRSPFTALRARLLCLVDQTLVEDTGAGSKLCTCLGEKPTVRIAKISRGPSAAGLAAHVRLHEPYRTWCPSRVAGRGVSNQPQFETKDGCVVPGSVSTAAILRGKLVLTSGALPWRCRTRVSNISCAAARAPRCCLGLDVRVWCSEVTQNQPWLLCVQHLVGTWQDNLALMGSLRTVRLDFFAGSVLAAHGAREMNAEARSLAHAVFFTVEGHVGSETSNGRLVGTVGGNDNPHRERGHGWAHCLGKRRFGPAFRRQTAEFGEKMLYMPTGGM